MQLFWVEEGHSLLSRQLDEDPGPFGAGKRDVEQEVRDESLQGNVVGPCQLSLEEEEQERLEGLEKRPLWEDADALVGKYLPVRLSLVLAQFEQVSLLLSQQGVLILFVEADRRPVHWEKKMSITMDFNFDELKRFIGPFVRPFLLWFLATYVFLEICF